MNTSSTNTTPEASVGSPILDPAGAEGPVTVIYDHTLTPPAIRIDSADGFMSLAQASAVARAILSLLDDLLPASDETLRALRMCLGVLNDARGTSHTVDSVAESLGMEHPLSEGEASKIARHIGGVLMS